MTDERDLHHFCANFLDQRLQAQALLGGEQNRKAREISRFVFEQQQQQQGREETHSRSCCLSGASEDEDCGGGGGGVLKREATFNLYCNNSCGVDSGEFSH